MKNEDFVAAYGDYAARLDVALRVGNLEEVGAISVEIANLLGLRYAACVNAQRVLENRFRGPGVFRIGDDALEELAGKLDAAADATVKIRDAVYIHGRFAVALARAVHALGGGE